MATPILKIGKKAEQQAFAGKGAGLCDGIVFDGEVDGRWE